MVGEVTAEAAAATGLPRARRSWPAAPITSPRRSSAGSVADGDLLLKFGGAGDILLATAQPLTDPRLFIDYHLVPGLCSAERLHGR